MSHIRELRERFGIRVCKLCFELVKHGEYDLFQAERGKRWHCICKKCQERLRKWLKGGDNVFGKKVIDTQEEDEARTDVACSEVERLIRMVGTARERSTDLIEEFTEKAKLYTDRIERLTKTKEFCDKIMETAS